MRVAILVNRVPDYSRPVFERLADRFDVSLFTYTDGAPTTIDGRAFGSVDVLGYPLSAAPRVLLSGEYDVAMAGGLNFFPTHAASLLTALRRLPFVVGPCDEWAGSQSVFTRALGPIKRGVARLGDSFVAPGAANRRYLESLGVDANDVILGPYAPCTIPPEREWERPASISFDDDPTILYFGRLVDRKGSLTVIDAFEKLDRDDCRLVIAGSGPLARTVTGRCENISGATALTRYLSHGEKAWLLAHAAVTCVPAVREPWGIVVTESLFVGTPVIASTEVAAARDQIENGVNGYVVPPRNAGRLATRLDSLEPLSAKAARKSVADCTVAHQADAFTTAINRACRHKQ
jgi:glycosyltransferase involved in cell wall biosynthesis